MNECICGEEVKPLFYKKGKQSISTRYVYCLREDQVRSIEEHFKLLYLAGSGKSDN